MSTTNSIRLSKKTLFPVLVFLFVSTIFMQPLSSSIQVPFEDSKQINFPSLEHIADLEILNDTAFETLNFEGNGSESSPYIIKDFIFEDSQVYVRTIGILIFNTSKFCEITNCTLTRKNTGIYLFNATNIAVFNSIVNSCPVGVVVNNCTDVEVLENTLTDCYGSAIYIHDSPRMLIANNIIGYSNYMGIGIYNSPSCIINNNTLEYCYEGIVVYDSPGSILTNNDFYLGGITFNSDIHQVEDYLTYIVENNTLNSEQIGFFKNVVNLDITEDIYSQIILVNCTNVNIVRIDFSDCITGLIAYFGEDIEVYECVFTHNLEGSIIMFYVEKANIEDTIISESNVYPGGILFYGCSNSEVRFSEIYDCNRGITFKLSNSCKAKYNRLEKCLVAGIVLDETNNCEISNNNCNRTQLPNTAGFLVMNSYNCSILRNIVEDNDAHAIQFLNTNYSLIYSNILRDNNLYGAYLDLYSSHNVIYKNEFSDNCLKGVPPEVNSQAWDSGENNTWHSEELKEGNYWNEHKGRKPYAIDGDASAQDLFPLRKSPFTTNFIVPVLSISIALIIVNRIRKKRVQ